MTMHIPFPTAGDWSVLWKGSLQEQGAADAHICALLVNVLWRLAACRASAGGVGGVLQYGLRHAETTLHALADTIHAFQLHGDPDMVNI